MIVLLSVFSAIVISVVSLLLFIAIRASATHGSLVSTMKALHQCNREEWSELTDNGKGWISPDRMDVFMTVEHWREMRWAYKLRNYPDKVVQHYADDYRKRINISTLFFGLFIIVFLALIYSAYVYL